MKKIHFTVGPSQLYPTVPEHINQAIREDIYSLSHRSETFAQINQETHAALRKLLDIPDTHHIFFTSCALEAMERTIANTVHKKSIHFVNGSFSREFYLIGKDLGKDVVRFDAPNGEGFDFASVTLPADAELVCLVQNETSTGVSTPMESVYEFKKRYPDVLFAIDIVSSVPYVSVDFSLIDIAFFSVQKGFGMPAGLGVMIVNEKALQKAGALSEKGITIGSYHSFPKYVEFEKIFQTRETPNVGAIYLLGKVAQDMIDNDVAAMRAEIEKKSAYIYDYFEKKTKYTPYVKEPFRSKTTIVIDVEGEAEKIASELAEKNFIIARGYGKRKDIHIRIGNFPTHSFDDVKQLISNF